MQAASGLKKCQFSHGKTNIRESHAQKCHPCAGKTRRAQSDTIVVVGFPGVKLHFLHTHTPRHQRIKLLKCFTGLSLGTPTASLLRSPFLTMRAEACKIH